MPTILRRCVAVWAAALCLVLLASPAGAQTSEQERNRCANADGRLGAEAQIRACSGLMREPHVSAQTRAYLLNNRGNGYRMAREYGRAIVDYDEAIQLDPTYANAYNNRGIAYRAAGAPELAIADFGR
ncbi:MAG: tetratricopeptide repeat protein, partial [Vitreimonas sp.]